MSNKGPGLFSDFDKKAKELLNKDYSTDLKITVSSSSEAGVAFAPSVVKKGGLYLGDVAARCKYKKAAVDFRLDTQSNVVTALSVTDVGPLTKAIASVKVPDYNSGKLELQYLQQHGSLTAAVGLNKSPAIDLSATMGTPSIAFGAEATYDTASREFAKYNTGFSYSHKDSNASIILADKGDSIRASYLQYLNKLNRGAVVGEISRKFSTNESTLTVGCSYLVDPQTTVKAKLNNHGNLGALLQHELKPNSFLTISGAFDTKALQNTPKFGLALSLKP
ncbi:hypothetical protein Tsubulata_038820 [Turnera subulata]|uniref:Uncharacterized protein n=1 Tax=Turnera subulata TaxID=218843 RepID=A0A9Q0JL02_9ROSI|nr:hypothetical protein Tsubulata_038820 [Turnera subulata]